MKDFRIDKSLTTGMEDDELLWEVIEPIWPSTEQEDTIYYISQGTKGQQAIYSITLFIREVDNGGLEQFFTNSSGKYINMVLDGLELINANEHLNTLKEAIKLFPGGKVPIDRYARIIIMNKQLKELKINESEYFEQFNKKLYNEERLHKYFLKYINEHEIEFFKE